MSDNTLRQQVRELELKVNHLEECLKEVMEVLILKEKVSQNGEYKYTEGEK